MLALDHIVVAAGDPEKAAESFGKKYNITVTEGGRHEDWGTYNYLAYFANNCYIEWIGIFDETTAARSTNPLIHLLFRELAEGQEGPVQLALRTQKMNDHVENLKTINMPYSGPVPGSRQRPDGSLLEWRMLFPEAKQKVLPFLIEWGDVMNTPQNSQLINDKTISTVAMPGTDSDTFTSIYQLDFTADHTARLDNGKLKLSDEFQFSID